MSLAIGLLQGISILDHLPTSEKEPRWPPAAATAAIISVQLWL
jgi:hypothetical protein